MKILLHACCGPCSLEPVRILREEGHDITIAYYNSNIAPASEYQHRLRTLLSWAHDQNIPVIEGPYEPERWHTIIKRAWYPERTTTHHTHLCEQEAAWEIGQRDLKARTNSQAVTEDKKADNTAEQDFSITNFLYRDRENRCRACYRMRLEATAHYAYEHGFEAIGTTLAVSPYQYTAIIEEELKQAARAYGLIALFQDYRPFYPNATKRSRELGMYRQNYCGCMYSNAEAANERAQRKVERKRKKEEERRAKLAALTTDDFDYNLPEELIAQEPAPIRDECKLLIMKRDTGTLEDKIFKDIIDYLNPGDLLVANETRVMPARLIGHKRKTGGTAEVFLLRQAQGTCSATPTIMEGPSRQSYKDLGPNQSALWEALVRPGKRLKPGAVVDFVRSDATTPFHDRNSHTDNTTNQKSNHDVILSAEIMDWIDGAQKGERLIRLSTTLPSLDEALHAVGHTPLPPYIKNYVGDEELYQTVYAHEERSAAAPTAGLHFTPELIERMKAKGVGWETVHLEVGLDTFRIVEEKNPRDHQIHTERYTVPQRTIDAVNRTKQHGGRVIAVGTTSVRSLESAWDANQGLIARDREATSLYILPGYDFKVVDGLITNFHVPRSTLMMLVSAFSTRDNIMKAYRHAIKRKYRMLSFGDAMFIR